MALGKDWKHILRGACLLAGLTPLAAFAGDRVGALECHTSGNGPAIIVENQTLDCVYEDDDEGAAPAHYIGKLTKVGANLNVNGPGELIWVVAAATNHLGPGALAGTYVGPEASAKIGAGGGGAILVGGSNNTVSLQPFTIEAGTGLGVTAGVERLELTYVPDEPPPAMRHKRRHHPHHHVTK